MKNEQKHLFRNSLIGFVFSFSLTAVLLTVNKPHASALGDHFDTTFHSDGWRVISFAGRDHSRDVAIQKIRMARSKRPGRKKRPPEIWFPHGLNLFE